MKRLKWLALFCAAVCLSFGMTSCGGGDDEPTPKTQNDGQNGDNSGGNNSGGNSGGDTGGNTGGNTNQGSTPMTEQEQKALLESTAREFIAEVSAADFETLTEAAQELQETNWENVDSWMEDILNATVRVALGDPIKTGEYDSEYSHTTYYTRNYKSTYLIANFKGHFQLRNNIWVNTSTNTNDLQFSFTDSKDANWLLKVETSGSVKKVHIFDSTDHRWEYDYSNNKYSSTNYTDFEQNIIGIPENLVVTLTRNGEQQVKTSLHTVLSDITNEEFDVSKNNVSLDCNTEIGQYKVEVSQVVYEASKKALVSATVKKGSKSLLTTAVTSDITWLPSCNISAFDNFDWDHTSSQNVNAKNAVVKLDVMGKVQIQGKVSDVFNFIQAMNDADDNKYDESSFKAKLAQANEYFNLGLFFNNNSTQQAKVYLEPFAKQTWNGNQRWTSDWVIKFNDNSSYSTCANFFSESNFKTVIDDANNLIESFEKLIK